MSLDAEARKDAREETLQEASQEKAKRPCLVFPLSVVLAQTRALPKSSAVARKLIADSMRGRAAPHLPLSNSAWCRQARRSKSSTDTTRGVLPRFVVRLLQSCAITREHLPSRPQSLKLLGEAKTHAFLQLEAGPVNEEEYQLFRSTTDLREPYR